MKHFIIDIHYTAEMSVIEEILPKHREFLQIGYDKGLLLMSGPKNPRTGGMIVCRGNSMEEIQEFFNNDPYVQNNAAEYKFVEFNPVKHQALVENSIAGK